MHVRIQNLIDMGFHETAGRTALEQTGSTSLEVAIDYINTMKTMDPKARVEQARNRADINAILDADGMHAILLRMVATCTAEHLNRCASVSRMWYAEAVDEELWRALMLRKWGEAAPQILDILQRDSIDASLSFRALYVRSVTTQVLSWGQGSRRQEDVGSAPRTPTFFNDGFCMRSVGIRQIAAGLWFSCAVTWSGKVLCWGVNTHAQCGVPAATAAYTAQPVELDLGERFAVQVSCGQEHAGTQFPCFTNSKLPILTQALRSAACVTTCGAVFCFTTRFTGPKVQILTQRLLRAACVTTCGAVFCWGGNSSDQLGQTRGAATPLLAGKLSTFMLY